MTDVPLFIKKTLKNLMLKVNNGTSDRKIVKKVILRQIADRLTIKLWKLVIEVIYPIKHNKFYNLIL